MTHITVYNNNIIILLDPFKKRSIIKLKNMLRGFAKNIDLVF